MDNITDVPVRKQKRVKMYKEDAVSRLALAEMRVHQLECDIDRITKLNWLGRVLVSVARQVMKA